VDVPRLVAEVAPEAEDVADLAAEAVVTSANGERFAEQHTLS
jgi:hypothetical protein